MRRRALHVFRRCSDGRVLRLTDAARRLLLHPEPAVQPRHHERLPAVAAAVEAHQAHQQRLEDKFFGFCGRFTIAYFSSRRRTRIGSAALHHAHHRRLEDSADFVPAVSE